MWQRFKQRYPKAEFSQFHTEDFFGRQNVFFDEFDGSETTVFDEGDFNPSIYFSKKMRRALGITTGFSLELTFNPAPKLSVPARPFSGGLDCALSIVGEKLMNMEIYVSPTDHFTITFRGIFTDTQITHYSGAESRHWLAEPRMSYWRQQLNFAIWCATTGCGVSQLILFDVDTH